MKWQACSQGLTYENNEGFIVYFDLLSGTTHLVNEVSAWLLAKLAVKPLSREQMRDYVVDQVENVSAPEAEKLVDSLIQELQSFDLIEAV